MDKSLSAVSIFNKYAVQYAAKFMNVDAYAESLDIFCANISKLHAEVLELACGPGNITKYLLQKRPDLKILGTDLAPDMLKLAKENNPQAEFQLLDCRQILSLNRKFDAIMCGFALPYLSKEEAVKLIADAAETLNKNGIIYISTMEDDYTKSGFKKGSGGDEIFMHYHEAEYLQKALEENGFELIELRRQDFHSENEAMNAVDLILIAGRSYLR
jgi:predicted TPR repeat methyltransferase